MVTKLNKFSFGDYTAQLSGVMPKNGQKCGYAHPIVTVFSKFQTKYGVTDYTTDAVKLFIFLAQKDDVDLTVSDFDRYATNTQEVKAVAPVVEILAVPVPAVADTSVLEIPVVEIKLEQKFIDFVSGCMKAGHQIPAIRSLLIDAHKLSLEEADAYCPL